MRFDEKHQSFLFFLLCNHFLFQWLIRSSNTCFVFPPPFQMKSTLCYRFFFLWLIWSSNICFVCFLHGWPVVFNVEYLNSYLSGEPTSTMTFLASYVLIMQNLRDMWVHCTQCHWCKWVWVVGAVEWGKWCCSWWTGALGSDPEILAGESISQLPARMYGLCICHLLALPLQCPLMKSVEAKRWQKLHFPLLQFLLQVPFL